MELEDVIKNLKQMWRETKFEETKKRLAIETAIQIIKERI